MKRSIVFSLVCFLFGFMIVGCQRDEGVNAKDEPADFQPRPAPPPDLETEIRGELIRIDKPRKTLTVRLENGMVQTFKFDDDTTVEGLPTSKPPKQGKARTQSVNDLAGKEGSEVTVEWDDGQDVVKIATNVEVTLLSQGRSRKR